MVKLSNIKSSTMQMKQWTYSVNGRQTSCQLSLFVIREKNSDVQQMKLAIWVIVYVRNGTKNNTKNNTKSGSKTAADTTVKKLDIAKNSWTACSKRMERPSEIAEQKFSISNTNEKHWQTVSRKSKYTCCSSKVEIREMSHRKKCLTSEKGWRKQQHQNTNFLPET